MTLKCIFHDIHEKYKQLALFPFPSCSVGFNNNLLFVLLSESGYSRKKWSNNSKQQDTRHYDKETLANLLKHATSSFFTTCYVCVSRLAISTAHSLNSQIPNLHKIPILIFRSSVHQFTSSDGLSLAAVSVPANDPHALLFLPPLPSDRLEAFPLFSA